MAQDDEQIPRTEQGNGHQEAGPDAIASGDGSYRVLANVLPQIIWTCDAEGRLEWINDRWTELTGLELAWSLENKNALDAVHPEDRPVIQQRFAQAYATASPCEFEYRIRTRHGDYRYHLARLAPLRRMTGTWGVE